MPHTATHTLLFCQQELARVPCGGECGVQGFARGERALLDLFEEAVDFHGDRGGGGRVHGANPVVSRKLSAS